MELPQEVREAAERIVSTEVIDAIRRVIRSDSEDRRRVYQSELDEAIDLYYADMELINKWLAKVEQKEES